MFTQSQLFLNASQDEREWLMIEYTNGAIDRLENTYNPPTRVQSSAMTDAYMAGWNGQHTKETMRQEVQALVGMTPLQLDDDFQNG